MEIVPWGNPPSGELKAGGVAKYILDLEGYISETVQDKT